MLMKKFVIAIFLLLCGVSILTAQAAEAEVLRYRYLSLSIMNVEGDDSYLSVMEKAAAAGINAFYLNVNWERIHPTRDAAAQWEQVDKQAALAEKLGCKIMLRLWLARHDDSTWWPAATQTVSGAGIHRKLLGGFSFNDQKAVAEANEFVREVAEHFRPRQQAGQIVLVAIATTGTAEAGYNVDAFVPALGKDSEQAFDYSPPSRAAFRTWLEAKYGDVQTLNTAWNSQYARFDEIEPPYTAGDVWSGNYGAAGRDWYLFRHESLKTLMDGFILTLIRVEPSYQYVHDFGSCYDALSVLRATLAFKDLCERADGIKVNDANSYPHRFATDLMRSNLPGKIIGHEVGNVGPGEVADWRRYIDEAFEHGADWVNLFGFDRDFNFPRGEELVKETNTKWLQTPRTKIEPTQTVRYTLSEAFHEGTGKVQERWRGEFDKTQQPITVILEEDMLDGNFKAD